MRRPWGRTVPGHGKTSEETPWLEQGVREGGGTVFYILDTSSLIFMTILHFKNVLIGSPEIFIKCPSHRTSKWQNRNLYVNLSGFNALAFLAVALQILFPFFLGVLKHLFLHAIKEAFQH